MVSSAVTEGEHMNYDSDNHYANWLNNKENALSISLKGSFSFVNVLFTVKFQPPQRNYNFTCISNT